MPNPAVKKNRRLTDNEYYVLLSLKSPLHGYAIMREASSLSDGDFDIGPATLYTVLQRLCENGYIQQEYNPNPRRKSYSLTVSGLDMLISEVCRRCAMAEQGVDVLTKLGCI